MEKTNNKNLVSVLMPAYNAEKYISAAIESILKQTYEYFELIMFVDCSTDGTWQIIRKYASKDKRIRAEKNPKNLDIAANRNKAIKLSSGKYVMWQDADDISYPDRIELQVKYLESHTDVGIVGGFLDFFSDSSEHDSTRRYRESDADIRKTIFRYTPVAQPAAMIRRECFDKVGCFDLNIPVAEDLDMNFRIGKYYKFANVQRPVIKYRVNDTQSTFKRLRLMEKNTIAIRRQYFNDPAYMASLQDRIYNFLQYASIYILPAKFKIALFNRLRNSKK